MQSFHHSQTPSLQWFSFTKDGEAGSIIERQEDLGRGHRLDRGLSPTDLAAS